jgi:hypothetical protein
LFDKVGKGTRIYPTAERYSVKLIQIRNNNPLLELYRHIHPLVGIPIVEPPVHENDILETLNRLPDSVFRVDKNMLAQVEEGNV